MGHEFITNPQVFLSPITAVAGIQGGLEKYPYIVGYESWSETLVADTTSISVPGAFLMAEEPEAYIISVGGVIQDPATYTPQIMGRTIDFIDTLSAGLVVNARQLATSTPSAQEFDVLKATNATIVSSLVVNTVSAFDINVQNIISTSDNSVFTFSTLKNLVSALAIEVQGTTLYIPLVSAV